MSIHCSEVSILPIPTGRMPNLLVIGAMKSGTTTLCHELSRHPDILFPEGKEPNAFVRHALGEPFALEDYSKIYRYRNEKILGDGSTGNSKAPFKPDVSEFVSRVLPKGTKIIYITRDPIARIERHIAHHIGNDLLSSPQSALFSGIEYLAISAYEMQLSYWRRYFPRHDILVITLEEYQSDRGGTLTRAFSHIGLDATPVIEKKAVYVNRGDSRRSAYKSPLRHLLHSSFYNRLREYFPVPLRRILALLLLPRASQVEVKLSPSEKVAALRAIERLNQLEAPGKDEVLGIVLSEKDKVNAHV